MGVGVFGKLPARRDYVQHGVDRRLMAALDPWLQQAMQDSRRALGQGWVDAWLQAPIWRFWLGRRVAGVTALGAMMPSVDGVGRYFPLAILGTVDADLPPPERHEQAAWFDAAEALMLDALSEGGTYEDLLAGLAALPAPATTAPAADEVVPVGTGVDVPGLFAALRDGMINEFYDRFSCWWVPSPDDGATPPRALIRRGLPSPEEFAAMIEPDRQAALTPALGES